MIKLPYTFINISSKIGIVGLGFFLVSNAYALGNAKAEYSVLNSTPSGAVRLHRNQKFVWAEYCPDNTCDVIRTSSGVSRDSFESLAGAYFYYFSKYIYLAEWQHDLSVGERVDRGLLSLKSEECSSVLGRDLARCEILRWNKNNSIQLISVRFDERRPESQRLRLEEALQ